MSAKNARSERQAIIDAAKAEDSKKDKARVWKIVGITVPIVAILGIIGYILFDASRGSGLEEVPPSAASLGAPFVLNSKAAPEGTPVLDLYEDFQCPFCKTFEDAFGDTMTDMAKNGEAVVQIHTMTFLDQNLGNSASKRALRGAAAADEQGKFSEFHRLVYLNQPEREGAGWSAEELKSFAEEAGVEDMAKWEASFKSDKWDAHISAIQDNVIEDGVGSTPTLKLDGVEITKELATPADLIKLVEEAKK